MIGKTNSLSGGDIKGETLKVSLRTNQSSHSDLNGVAFTLEYADSSERYVWEGSDIIIKLPPYLSYTITPEDVDGYKTPSVYSSTSIGGFQKTATLEYQCTIVTVKSDDNQPNYNDVSASTATVSASGMTTKTIPNGGTAKVPTGNACTITWGAISGYKTPNSQTFTASGTSVTKTGTYQTEILTVNVIPPSNKTYQITVSGIGSQTTTSKIYKIPFGTSYTVSASSIQGFEVTPPQSFTANSASRNITIEYSKAAIDLSLQDIFGNSISQTTANCYVVKNEGEYKLPIVFGNAIKNGANNSAAYTKNSGSYSHDFVNYKDVAITSPYIEVDTGVDAMSVELSLADTDNVFSDFSIMDGSPCRYIKFKVNSIPSIGANGIISILDSSGTVMWSWHIWVWADDLTPVTITNATGVNYNILPVNLASKKTSGGSFLNWYYQWGRSVPMLLQKSYSSTSDPEYYGSKQFIKSKTSALTYGEGIKNPHIFYGDSSSNSSWFDSQLFYNLWDANCTAAGASDNNVVKTIYDPCPIGFKVPNGNTFTYFSKTNVVGSFTYGWKFKRNANDTKGVFFPTSGYRRYDGTLSGSFGGDGMYWLAAVDGTKYAYSMNFKQTQLHLSWTYTSYGYSVRPVQE